MKRRVLAVLLALCMCVGLLPATALADGEANGTPESEITCICDTKCTEDSWNEDCPVCKDGYELCAAPGDAEEKPSAPSETPEDPLKLEEETSEEPTGDAPVPPAGNSLTAEEEPVALNETEPTDENVIYVGGKGASDDNSGSREAPYATLAKAVEVAKDGATIYVMSNLTMTKSARYYGKNLTITSGDGGPYTITRGENFDQIQDNARSTYNPAMIEVDSTDGPNTASLTLTHIILNDAGIREGEYFIQADSESDGDTDFGDLTGENAISNTAIVQDAMIATYNGVATITLGDGAVLKNYGGMSAVRLSSGTLIMESGSVICDDTVTDRVKGTTIPGANTSYYGPAGAIWMQGGELIMEEDSKISNIVGRAIYNESGNAELNGLIEGTKVDVDMWWGSYENGHETVNGFIMHMRSNATAVLGAAAVIDNDGITAYGSGIAVLGGCKLTMDNGAVVTGFDNGNVFDIGGTAFLNGEITGLTGGSHAIVAQSSSNHYIRIGETANIHDNICNYGVIYTQGSNGVIDIYGKINDNISTDRGGALTLANNGTHVEVNMYDGAEMCNNVSYQTGGGVMVSCGTFTMYGGIISGNISGAGNVGAGDQVGGGVYVRRGGQFIMNGGEITGNMAAGIGGGIAFEAGDYNEIVPYIQLNGGTISGNKMNATVSGNDTDGYTAADGESNDISLTIGGSGYVDRYLTISPEMTIGNADIYMQKGDFYIERVNDMKLGNASTTSENALKRASSEKGWSDTPLATFWLQSANAVTLNLSGIEKGTDSQDLPVYALVMPTGETGDVETGTTATVYALTENGDGSMTFTIPAGNTNGYAVALVQPTTNYGTLTITPDPTSIEEDPNTETYTVHYQATYDISGNLTSLIDENGGTQGFTLTIKLDDDLAYTENSMTVTGVTASEITANYDGTITVTFPVTSTTTLVTFTFEATATLGEDDFDSGDKLVTSGELSATVGAIPVHVAADPAVTDLIAYVEPTPDPDPDPGTGGGGTGSDKSNPYLRFDSNGGTAFAPIDGHGASFTINPYNDDEYGTHIPSRPGYRFTGWYRDSRLTMRVDEDTALRITNSVTLFAGWTETSVPSMLNGDDHYAYIQGYADGTVRPNANITRAQVATIFFRLLDEDVREDYLTTSNAFPDVSEDYWANTAISTMARLGVINGRNSGNFDPNAYITRAEFAAICARFDDSGVTSVSTFTDTDGHWAEEEISRAAALGWIQGYSDGTFRPNQYITRAQAVTMINRVLCRLPEDADDLLPGMNTWTDCREGDWYYLAIQEATNSHDFDAKDQVYETWTDLNADPDWSRYE